MAVLGLGGSAGPSHVEDMGDIGQRRELRLSVAGVGDVALDVLDGMIGSPAGTGTAGDAVDLPGAAGSVGQRENLGEAVADDAGDADHECHALEASWGFVKFLPATANSSIPPPPTHVSAQLAYVLDEEQVTIEERSLWFVDEGDKTRLFKLMNNRWFGVFSTW